MFATPFLDPLNRTHPHIIPFRNCDPEVPVVDIIEAFLKF
jgi:hypothetical protein